MSTLKDHEAVVGRDEAKGVAFGGGSLRTPRGVDLLQAPLLNKGTAFTEAERKAFGLDGLLPPVIETLDQQSAPGVRGVPGIRDRPGTTHQPAGAPGHQRGPLLPAPSRPYRGDAADRLHADRRRWRASNSATSTAGTAGCSSPIHTGTTSARCCGTAPTARWTSSLSRTASESSALATRAPAVWASRSASFRCTPLVGGIHPARTLPIVLDVGTNNQERRDDPEYIGWRHERVTGQAYFDFVERFVQAVQAELPETLLQWEDFATPHARPILERYRDQLLTFNDDIQGTAAVALGAILGAVSVTGKRLPDQRVVFLGAGSAAIGVADYLRAAMVQEGLSEAEARSRFWLVDKDGLLHSGRGDLTAEQRVYAQPIDRVANWPRTSDGKIGLADVIGQVEATILIGLSTVGGAFTEPIVREMARKAERPVIFPLSNPTARSEANPEDLVRWTGGRALIATGSPFAPVAYDGRLIPIAQCNNVFIFPAVGLGVIASGASRVTDGMMLAAARALGENSPARQNPSGSLLPAICDLRTVAVAIATSVGLEAQRAGIAPSPVPRSCAPVLRPVSGRRSTSRSFSAGERRSAEYESFPCRLIEPDGPAQVEKHLDALAILDRLARRQPGDQPVRSQGQRRQ